MSFLTELRRRKVIKVTLAYVVGAWLVLQLADVLSELLDLPDVVGRVVVAVAALGLPVTIFLSWAYELTAEGLKRDSEVSPEARSSGKLINVLVIGLLAAALGYFVWESRFREPGAANAMPPTASASTNAPAGADDTPGIGRSIAVLPFENFSGNPGDAYFADGLSDTLLHQLAQLEELKVIARNSSFQYKGSNQDVREIGAELGVETILEGSVQRASDQVRIIAQLVRTSDGAHVWSKTFDDSMDNIFALQDRVSAEIVDAFQISLSAAERERLMRDGTDNPAAYDLLIQARAVDRNVDTMTDIVPEDDPKLALLQQALALDPGYAQAWAELARAWNGLAFATDSATEWERYVAESDKAARKAVELDPDLPAAHDALGWVAHRRGERLEAERHFRRALELDANDLGAMSGLALQLWRDPEAALALLDRSIAIDPKSAITQRQRHFMLFGLGRLDEAIDALHRAIELEPDEGMYYNDLYDLYELKGRPDEGARLISELLRRSPGSFEGQAAMAEAWIAATDFERAGQWIETLMRDRPDSDTAKLLEVERLIGAGRHAEVIDLLAGLPDNRRTDWQIRSLSTSSCLQLERLECARRELDRYQQLLAENALRGDGAPVFKAWAALLELLLREREGSPPPPVADLERILEAFQQSRLFRYNTNYLNAGLLVRLGRRDEALARLELAIRGEDGAVQNIDVYGETADRSMLLDPLRGEPAFADWLERYRLRRNAMLSRMADLEMLGEIIRPEMVERMAGS